MLTGLNHVTLAVKDLDVSVEFYHSLLEFKLRARWESGAYLELGELWLCLSHGQACPAQDYTHIAFTVAQENFETFSNKIAKAGTNRWKQNTSEGDSIYFLDPDGHKLEVHVGNLMSRLGSLRVMPYENLVFFD